MDIKETPDMWVLSLQQRLKIPDIRNAAAHCAAEIETSIEKEGLTASGPWTFISWNLPRDSKTLFDWRICRPVVKPDLSRGKIPLLHLEPIMVAARTHLGSLRTLFTQGYAPLVHEIQMSRHAFSGESREVYHDWRGPGAGYQRIEIQFGLSR